MTQRGMSLPSIIAHCDWSTSSRKRWMAWATLGPDGGYYAQELRRVEDPLRLISMLRGHAASGSTLLGFDFPIGISEYFAKIAEVHDFLRLLPLLGKSEPWNRFYEICERPGEISIYRPFYPRCPGGTRQRYLTDALGAKTFGDLRRRCERPYPGRRAACPLFWTLGANQAGRAAISGWQEVLAPALRDDPDHVFVWPFSGSLGDRLQPGSVVVAETYPAEYYRHLGVRLGPAAGGKCSQDARRANAPALMSVAEGLRVHPSAQLQDAIERGFPSDTGGDDGFDAFVGLLGMMKVVRGELPAAAPDRDVIRRVEGWILGQSEEP